VATRMAGSEVRAGETGRPKGQHRAPARPYYYLLEDDLECWLLNAHHLRNVPGRKTDISDAAWICQLVEHGLVRPSFVPPRPIRQLRDLTRYRKVVIQERTREVQRLEKVLEDAGIKLSSVASDILGVSGRAMLAALIGGSLDPAAMAELAKGRLRAKLPELRAALRGHFDGHHGLLAAEMLARIDADDETIQRLSEEVDRVIAPYASALTLLETIPGVARRTAWGDRGRDRRRHGSVPKRCPPRLLGGHVPRHRRIGRQAPLRQDPQGPPSGCAASWSRPPTPPPAPATPTWRPSTGALADAATTNGPRSRSATPSWSAPTTCSTGASRTPSSAATTSWSASPTRPTSAGSSASSSALATRSASSQPNPPPEHTRSLALRGRNGSTPPEGFSTQTVSRQPQLVGRTRTDPLPLEGRPG
jgi:transposase